jgi:hypothetical protein
VVDGVLAKTFRELENELLTGPAWLRRLGERTALPWIRHLRRKAWRDGRILWDLRNHPRDLRLFGDLLDEETRIEEDADLALRLRAPSIKSQN